MVKLAKKTVNLEKEILAEEHLWLFLLYTIYSNNATDLIFQLYNFQKANFIKRNS